MSAFKVGYALGAGAGWGLAHIGVLEVLEDNGIKPDMVAGCSMGSIIGALYCTGMCPADLQKLAQNLSERIFLDPVPPRMALFRGEKAEILINTLTKRRTCEEADIPFACVAVDLQTGGAVILDKGPISKAVRASISIPGVFEPVQSEDRLLVDGGLIERVPIPTVKAMGADFIIAVDVGFSGRTATVGRNIISILLRSWMIADWNNAKAMYKDADVVIMPQVEQYSPASLRDAEKIIEEGRKAAQAAIPSIKIKLKSVTKETNIRA